MRIAAIDIGTNTAQLVVADVGPDGFDIVAEEERFARLGQGVDASRRLAPEAMDRAMNCLAESQATAQRLGAEQTVIGATSASRDARNAGDLVGRVRDELGLEYRVISGREEARLSFLGALALAPDLDRAVVLDVGGGSTELIVGTRADGPAERVSVDVGSVRLTERHLAERPATPAALEAAREDVRRALETVPSAIWAALASGSGAGSGVPLLATGSVAKILARLAGIADSGLVTAETIHREAERLAALTPAETLAGDASLAGREDVIAAAVLVVSETLRVLGVAGYRPSAGGLRHGLALEAAGLVTDAGPTPIDLKQARSVVQSADLPTADLGPAQSWLGAWSGSDLAGVVATESYGSDAVLRSLAVRRRARGEGVGAALVAAAEAQAAAGGARRLALLTTDATSFFERLGYTVTDRASLSDAVRASSQFADVCPDSAVCLSKSI